MNAKIKELWLKALRSGEYEQTQGYLRQNGKFCCLGVLCDLHAKAGLGSWNTEHYLSENRVLPFTVRDWADLDEVEPCDEHGQTLSGINDNGMSFKEIANVIERDL